jgi:hypothetical protein
MAEEIGILLGFRDKYRLTNPLGKDLLKLHYKDSPPMAEFITEHPSRKPIVSVGLFSTVAIIGLAVKTTLAEKTAIVGLSALVSVVIFQLFHLR